MLLRAEDAEIPSLPTAAAEWHSNVNAFVGFTLRISAPWDANWNVSANKPDTIVRISFLPDARLVETLPGQTVLQAAFCRDQAYPCLW
jgi:hypothetical protein